MSEQKLSQEDERIKGATRAFLVEEILRGEIEDINWTSEDGETALHLAVRNGDAESVRRLLERGVNVNALNKSGQTALDVAMDLDDLSSVNYLARGGADLTLQDNSGRTAKERLGDWLFSVYIRESAQALVMQGPLYYLVYSGRSPGSIMSNEMLLLQQTFLCIYSGMQPSLGIPAAAEAKPAARAAAPKEQAGREDKEEKLRQFQFFKPMPGKIMQERILPHLTPRQLTDLAVVSRKWHTMLSDDKLWERFLQEGYRTDIKVFKAKKDVFLHEPEKRLIPHQPIPQQLPYPVRALSMMTGVHPAPLYSWYSSNDRRYNLVLQAAWYLGNGVQQPPRPHALSLEDVMKLDDQQAKNLMIAVLYLQEGHFTSIDEIMTLREEERQLLAKGSDIAMPEPEARAAAFLAYKDYREQNPLTPVAPQL